MDDGQADLRKKFLLGDLVFLVVMLVAGLAFHVPSELLLDGLIVLTGLNVAISLALSSREDDP